MKTNTFAVALLALAAVAFAHQEDKVEYSDVLQEYVDLEEALIAYGAGNSSSYESALASLEASLTAFLKHHSKKHDVSFKKVEWHASSDLTKMQKAILRKVGQLAYAVRSDGVVTDTVFFGKTDPGPFVKRDGTKLTLDGGDFFCAGSNGPFLSTIEIMHENEIPVLMKLHKDAGANCLRIFAFSNGEDRKRGTGVPMQVSPGEQNEASEFGFRRMDRLVREAGRQGIKLIMTLGNGYTYQGGADWYAKQILNSDNYADFYWNEKTKAAYKTWIETILNRANFYTGITYKDDAAILAWEVINEAHLPDGTETKAKLQPGKILLDWFDEMSTYIRSIDEKHLIGTGEEGYRSDQTPNWSKRIMEPSGAPLDEDWWWIDAGLKGMDFVGIANLPNIDISTLHIIPEVWNIKKDELDTWLNSFIGSRVNITNTANKALIITEFGMTTDYMPEVDFVNKFAELCMKYNVAGCMEWPQMNVGAEKLTKEVADHYESEGGQAVKALYAQFAKKSGPAAFGTTGLGASGPDACTCTDVVPPEGDAELGCQVLTNYPDGALGKVDNCDSDFMAGYCNVSCNRCDCKSPAA